MHTLINNIINLYFTLSIDELQVPIILIILKFISHFYYIFNL